MVHFRLLLLTGIPYAIVAMTLLLISLPLPLLSSEFEIPEIYAGFLGGSVFIGMFLGATFFGVLADRIGRKRSLVLALILLGLSTLICSVTPSWETFILMRVLTGLGIGGSIPVFFVYLAEFTGLEDRGKTLVLLDSFWAYGWIIASFLGFMVIPAYGWRSYFLVSSVIIFLTAIPLHFLLRETPLYRKRGRRVKIIESIKLLWSKTLRRATASTWIMWFSMVFGCYSFFLWIIGYMRRMGFNLPEAYALNLLTSFAQIPGYFSAAYLIDKVGRKPTLVSYALLTALSVFGFSSATSPIGVTTWLSLVCFFCLGAWGVVMCYTSEPYPTSVRGTGYGFASGFGRIAGIIGPTIIGFLLQSLELSGTLSVVSFAFIILAVDMAILGLETKGKELE